MKTFRIPALIFIFCLCGSMTGGNKNGNEPGGPAEGPVSLVYPYLDTAHSRWLYFSSACRPFGMVNLSPDTKIDGIWGAGYLYNLDTIRAFSHIHAWQLSGIPVLPVAGEFRGHLGPGKYGSKYSHENETVKPGYHQVLLADYNIDAELTSTTRVGFHRYTFEDPGMSHILFDFTTVLGPSATRSGYVRKISNSELEGYAVMEANIRRPKPVTVFFAAEFDKPFEFFGGWKEGRLIDVKDVIEGKATGAYVSFTAAAREVRQMKVGISYVSTEQARLNLDTELPHWDFDRVVLESAGEWNRWLSRIEIEGGTEKEQRRFYTDLWKALQGRRIVSDVNGKYLDMTGPEPRTGQIPTDENGNPLFNHHSSDSFWGAQWNLNTLWHLVYPEVTASFVNSMLLMYDDGGLIPRGPSGGNYTFVMTGASSTPFIVSAYMKGIGGFDVKKAYEGMRKNHLPGGLMSKAGYEHNTFIGGGIESYIEKGYIPYPLTEKNYGFHQRGSGQTLEYAYQDWALAQMAKKLGYTEDYKIFSARALNYRNIFHADSGWMWVREKDGSWREPFNIYDGTLFVEGNAAQYTWWVPHDVPGLIELMGGKEKFTARLNRSFESAQKHNFTAGESHAVENLYPEVYINYGNQPCLHTAFLFNYSAPWLTQYWSRKIVEQIYSDLSPERGYRGDEDQGQMGSLAVLMKIGLFSVNGGTSAEPYYEIGSPVFDKITIHLNQDYYTGETFVIETRGNGPGNYYIRSAGLNNLPLEQPFVYHKDVVNGGTLDLLMGPVPEKSWGTRSTFTLE
jgi:predicted alpha-1,2-mannosidase